MTMEVEVDQSEASAPESIDKDHIIDFLTNNETICFKSQQRGEDDLTKLQKIEIATEIYNKSKLNFLVRFGKYLEKSHLQFFQQFTRNCDKSDEIEILLKEFMGSVSNAHQIRNRRYQALQKMIQEDSYFSEVEMMKRNPLLYEQLVNQYLTEDERIERDRANITAESTLVKVLMEGIERDCAQAKKQQQEAYEDDVMEEEEDSDSDEEMKISRTNWGEFIDEPKASTSVKSKTVYIDPEEQKLLKEEFITLMYENFLSGQDDDFNYDSVDNNDTFDAIDLKQNDAEDKYFDSEEAETVDCSKELEESEDELDMFMSALNPHPGVSQLSEDIQKL